MFASTAAPQAMTCELNLIHRRMHGIVLLFGVFMVKGASSPRDACQHASYLNPTLKMFRGSYQFILYS